jgi:hypothetical protein
MVVESRGGKREKRYASLALRKQGQQLKNRVRSRIEGEADNAVTVVSCIPFLAAQTYKSARESYREII